MKRPRRQPTRAELTSITSRRPVVRRITAPGAPCNTPESYVSNDEARGQSYRRGAKKRGGQLVGQDTGGMRNCRDRERDRVARDRDRERERTMREEEDKQAAETERRSEQLKEAWRQHHPREDRDKGRPRKGGAL